MSDPRKPYQNADSMSSAPSSAPPERKGDASSGALTQPEGSSGQASPELFRKLVEAVQDYAIFFIEPSGTIVSWNEGAERLKGYTPEEIIGKNFSIFYTPEDLAAGKPEKLLSMAATEGHVIDEGWRVRKDGSRFWASVNLTALRENDELVGYAKITHDLTERRIVEAKLRESEERFRLLVRSVKDYAIFLLDPDGYVVSWNEGAERIKGYTEDEIIGQHFSIFYPPESRDRAQRELETAIREGRAEDQGWRIRKDGSRFWADVALTPLRKPSGELVGLAEVTRDLTERLQAQERAITDAKRVAAAEAANQAKTEFLAAMSHELRTPLNAIGGYVDLLKMGLRGPVTSDQIQDLERINHAQRHLLSLINDILNYSRIEAGRLLYDIQAIPVSEVIEPVTAIIEPQARSAGIELELAPPPAVTVKADRVKVEQILLNLLTNALKFTPAEGSVRLTTSVSPTLVKIFVSDTGIGIPEEEKDRIFEPFVQLGRSLSSGSHGAGLGLAISRDLARGMGGDLKVVSAPGEGSTFILELPRG